MIDSINSDRNKDQYQEDEKHNSNTLINPLQYPRVTLGYNTFRFWKTSPSQTKLLQIDLQPKNHQFDLEEFILCRIQRQKITQAFITQKQSKKGKFHLYNWISDDPFLFEGPLSYENNYGKLAMLIIQYKFKQAEKVLKEMEKTFFTSYLHKIICGFKNILKLINSNEELKRTFLNRDTSEIQGEEKVNFHQAAEFHHQNYLMEPNLPKFFEIESLDIKKALVFQNIRYLIDFVSKISKQKMNDYQKLIFTFLQSNNIQNKQTQLFKLLCTLRSIRIEDRLNFCQKILSIQERSLISQQLHHFFITLPSLNNLIYFRICEIKQIHIIIKNYLDNYGELQVIAYLALQYNEPQLMTYIELYLELLSIGNQNKKIEQFESEKYKKYESIPSLKSIKQINLSEVKSFSAHINVKEDKINFEDKKIHSSRLCHVCYESNTSQEYVQCAKCHHGGHLIHLKKWFDQSSLCPKNDCPCICN